MTLPLGHIEQQIRDGFIRQRRSLIAASFVLLAYVSAGVGFPSKLIIFGSEFPIQRPEWIGVALWVVWGYLLLRYYQYYRDHPDRHFVVQRRREIFSQLAKKVAYRRFERQFQKEHEWRGSASFNYTKTGFVPGSDLILEVGGTAHRVYESESGPQVETRPFAEPILIPGARLLPTRARAWVGVILQTRLVTEFYLPFVVASAPVLAITGRAVAPLLRRFV